MLSVAVRKNNGPCAQIYFSSAIKLLNVLMKIFQWKRLVVTDQTRESMKLSHHNELHYTDSIQILLL